MYSSVILFIYIFKKKNRFTPRVWLTLLFSVPIKGQKESGFERLEKLLKKILSKHACYGQTTVIYGKTKVETEPSMKCFSKPTILHPGGRVLCMLGKRHTIICSSREDAWSNNSNTSNSHLLILSEECNKTWPLMCNSKIQDYFKQTLQTTYDYYYVWKFFHKWF